MDGIGAAPGSSPYCRAVYGYARNGRAKSFKCYVLGEPPKEATLFVSRFGVFPEGELASRCCRARGFGWIAYRGTDRLAARFLAVAVAVLVPCLAAWVVLRLMPLFLG